ncbi:S-adenosylmethionine:tRNA ribosyltransferase-isomerase [Hamadaea tsunoensis]|uniref:S-adenosylmethionine:tRNA ribosyltransferase-isomerase n=1 Tax=Hamadaea tsunoensis TaxID=53368 RepID=UPI0004196657|nr:S-adenosylmethionine:tRNA ribosyltransferase-isomerase [Hamadaea tsunoensis]
MTTATLDFTLAPELEAHEPPEARGLSRDEVRLLVGKRPNQVAHHRFTDLPDLLRPGDVLVVNTSATMAAAVPSWDGTLVVHFSTRQPAGERLREPPEVQPAGERLREPPEVQPAGERLREPPEVQSATWVVELREPVGRTTQRFRSGYVGQNVTLRGGANITLLAPYTERLWIAEPSFADVPAYLRRNGRPIRYSYVEKEWPLSAYHSVFAETGDREGSAEMPSASRPFTEALVTRLASRGVVVAPITLHTGVASHEADEKPYAEHFTVGATTARLVNEARAAGGRIIAVGTTAVRALESATGPDGVRAAAGWTELVITPETGVRVVDGLLTGFHEPRASHLLMLAAIAGEELLAACYTEAIEAGYLWHEFGDLNLLLR